MAPKRKDRSPRHRDKIIERQHYESMELALIDYQSTDLEEEIEAEDSAKEGGLEAKATEEAGRAEEVAAEPAQSEAQAEEAQEQSEASESDEQEEEALEAQTAETEETQEVEEQEEVIEVQSTTASQAPETLPPKTEHDPTSHTEAPEEAGSWFWAFLLLLIMIAVLMLTRS